MINRKKQPSQQGASAGVEINAAVRSECSVQLFVCKKAGEF